VFVGGQEFLYHSSCIVGRELSYYFVAKCPRCHCDRNISVSKVELLLQIPLGEDRSRIGYASILHPSSRLCCLKFLCGHSVLYLRSSCFKEEATDLLRRDLLKALIVEESLMDLETKSVGYEVVVAGCIRQD
jgi:hypothetical protein